jgi:type IV pilus assembly protein PilA
MLISRLTQASQTLDSATHGGFNGASDPHSSDTNPGSAHDIGSESGFTLIELMVVLLIIAILLAIAIPTFLGVTNTAGDRAAQSNLTNALTEAKALYEVNQAYSNQGVVYTSGSFLSQAPEFTWQTASCSTSTSGNCVSFAVADASVLGDGQALALAAWSAKTSTCWYALDLEVAPGAITPAEANAVVGQASSKNTAPPTLSPTLPTAGVFYGKNTATGGSCQASKALDPTNSAVWATSYSKAGTVN